MIRYELINKEMIVSHTARRVYRASAWLSIILFIEVWALQFENINIPAILGPALRLLLFLGILGAAITLIGMEWFLFRFDDSHALKQVLWFCVMIFPLLGAPLYCFFVYSRSKYFRSSTENRTEGATA